MDKFLINGGTPLRGEVSISGAKNAVLPIIGCDAAHLGPVRHPPRPAIERRAVHGRNPRLARRAVKLDGNTLTVRADNVKGLGDYD